MLKSGKLLAVMVAALVTVAVAAPHASAQTPDVVIQWNQMIQTLFGGTGPGIHLRAMPMMHIAMFDAINSIEGDYTPYLGAVKASRGASAEAAAAVAAHDVLVALYPTQQAALDALRDAQLEGLPHASPSRARPSVRRRPPPC